MNKTTMLLGLLLSTATIVPAHAHDSDAAHDHWYESLTRPDFPGQSCCNLIDCKPTDYRVNKDGHYEVYIDAKVFTSNNPGYSGWVVVPDARVIRDKKVLANNPTGMAITCWMPSTGVMCFVPSNGT